MRNIREVDFRPSNPQNKCVISEVQMQSYYPKDAKIGRGKILPEGGTEDQSIVDASQRLNLNAINSNSNSFSDSISSQESDMSNR